MSNIFTMFIFKIFSVVLLLKFLRNCGSLSIILISQINNFSWVFPSFRHNYIYDIQKNIMQGFVSFKFTSPFYRKVLQNRIWNASYKLTFFLFEFYYSDSKIGYK